MAPEPQTEPSLDALLSLVRRLTGLRFREGDRRRVLAAVEATMRQFGLDEVAELYTLVRDDDAVRDGLIGRLAIGETYFFREPAHFRFIEREVLPKALARPGLVHIWSAGCASGEEAYSLAVAVREMGVEDRVRILATDVSRPLVERAKEGIYRAWSLRTSESERMRPYLEELEDGRFAVDRSLRRSVEFCPMNLVLDPAPCGREGEPVFDLILCRNVMIYFDPASVRAVADRLRSCLLPGGWLVTSSPDPPLGAVEGLESVSVEEGVFYRRVEPAAPRRAPRDDPASRSASDRHPTIEPGRPGPKKGPGGPTGSGPARPLPARPTSSPPRPPLDEEEERVAVEAARDALAARRPDGPVPLCDEQRFADLVEGLNGEIEPIQRHTGPETEDV